MINYSSRFSITGLTQTTPAQYSEAAQKLNGSTDGPPAVGNDASSATTSSASTSQATTTPSKTLDGTTSSGTIVATATVAPTTESTSTPTADSSSTTSDGLSSGAVAGIIAACAILVGALLAASATWYIRRRRQTKGLPEEIAHQNPFLDDKAELSAVDEPKPPRAWTHFAELSTESVVHEADDGRQRPELDHMAFRAELEGSTPVTPRSGV